MTPEDRARRDLERIEQEREKLLAAPPRAANDDTDPMEILGKRIARILGPLLGAAMLLYLLATYWPQA